MSSAPRGRPVDARRVDDHRGVVRGPRLDQVVGRGVAEQVREPTRLEPPAPPPPATGPPARPTHGSSRTRRRPALPSPRGGGGPHAPTAAGSSGPRPRRAGGSRSRGRRTPARPAARDPPGRRPGARGPRGSRRPDGSSGRPRAKLVTSSPRVSAAKRPRARAVRSRFSARFTQRAPVCRQFVGTAHSCAMTRRSSIVMALTSAAIVCSPAQREVLGCRRRGEDRPAGHRRLRAAAGQGRRHRLRLGADHPEGGAALRRHHELPGARRRREPQHHRARGERDGQRDQPPGRAPTHRPQARGGTRAADDGAARLPADRAAHLGPAAAAVRRGPGSEPGPPRLGVGAVERGGRLLPGARGRLPRRGDRAAAARRAPARGGPRVPVQRDEHRRARASPTSPTR